MTPPPPSACHFFFSWHFHFLYSSPRKHIDSKECIHPLNRTYYGPDIVQDAKDVMKNETQLTSSPGGKTDLSAPHYTGERENSGLRVARYMGRVEVSRQSGVI